MTLTLQVITQGAEAYGQIYLPEKVYTDNKEVLDNLSMYVYDLDGKHSEEECDVEIEKDSLGNFIKKYAYKGVGDYKDLNVDLSYSIKTILNLNYSQLQKLDELTEKIIELSEIKTKVITLTNDTILEGIKLPKNTRLSYSAHPEVKDGVLFEIDLNKF